MSGKNCLGNEEIPVIAYDKDGKEIGRYDSISIAARKLYIRNAGRISKSLKRKRVSKAGRKTKGIDNKFGEHYTFEKLESNGSKSKN